MITCLFVLGIHSTGSYTFFLSSLLHFGMVTLGDVCPQSIAAAAALLMSILCPVHSAMRARVGERLPDQPLAV